MTAFLAHLRRGLAADGPILGGMFGFWLVSLAGLAAIGINGPSVRAYRDNLALYLAAFLILSTIALATALVRHKPDRPIGFLVASARQNNLAGRVASGLPMLAALVVFMPMFSMLKSAIPRFNSYTWDNTWIVLDRAVHGTDPWLLLQPLVGYPAVTALLALFYHLWILLLYLGAVYFCFFKADRELRARFFIAYFACWAILGVVLATALASVGPCFVGPLFGDHRFDALMAYLRVTNESYPVMVLPVQDMLLESYRSADTGLGRGISAMPSMHVSIAVLFALAVGLQSRALGIVFGLFAGIVLISSVHLGYHYAVDGYVAIAGTWLIWLAAGVLARRLMRDAGLGQPAAAPRQ